MTTAIIIMGSLGVIVGLGLAVASKIFYVYVDPQVMAVDDALPGANCGGCGFPGCTPNAEAIVAGKSSPNSCVAAGSDVAEAIAGIMGVSVEATEPDIALPGCTYGVEEADVKYLYEGLSDCRAAAMLSGGMKVCTIGCLGLGSCVKACQFGALKMGPDGLPTVSEKKCTGCGACERVCPKHIIKLSSVTRRLMQEYTLEDCTTPCQRACPAGIDICSYIDHIQKGDYATAVEVIKERNPFPTVIGRICPRPCEDECRRMLVDESVSINSLKRFAADYEMSKGVRVQPYRAPETGRKIAVVGGGVQGLSTAFFAARLGHATTVFEATDQLGGLLRSAIHENRLTKEVLDWDVDGVLEMGVTAETGQKMGDDFTVSSLLGQGFEAVFLATGGWDNRLVRGVIDTFEQPVPGVHLMIDLLRFANENPEAFNCGKHVVIAGGDKAIWSAATALKAVGVKKVTVILQAQDGELPFQDGNIDPEALPEVEVLTGGGVIGILGVDQQLTGIQWKELATGNVQEISTDALILPMGRFPQFIFTAQNEEGDNPDASDNNDGPIRWQAFEPYKAPEQSGQAGLLAKGDVLSDFSGAIRAIGAGRRAAAAIHQAMYGIELSLPANVVTPDSPVQNVDMVVPTRTFPRQISPLDPSPDAVELEQGLSEDKARKEAGRCLQCGLICYRKYPPKKEGTKIEEVAAA